MAQHTVGVLQREGGSPSGSESLRPPREDSPSDSARWTPAGLQGRKGEPEPTHAISEPPGGGGNAPGTPLVGSGSRSLRGLARMRRFWLRQTTYNIGTRPWKGCARVRTRNVRAATRVLHRLLAVAGGNGARLTSLVTQIGPVQSGWQESRHDEVALGRAAFLLDLPVVGVDRR